MIMPIPFDVENIAASSYTPRGVIKSNNAAFRFFCRYLWEKILSVYTFKLPKTFGKELFLNALFANGVVTVIETAQYGLLAQWGNFGGYNVNYQPRYMLFSNPLLPEYSGRELIIGQDCAVIRLTEDWRGVLDLISFYAGKLALASQAVDVNLVNSKLAYVFAAKDKTQAQSFKKLMDTINSGETSVVTDKSLFGENGEAQWQAFEQNLKQTYLVTDLLNDFAKIEDEFNTRIGIPNANTEKRERLIKDEVNANNVETSILAAGWLENIRDGCKMVKEMYGAEITVDWRFKPYAVSDDAEQSNNVSDRVV
mgnify:CR=1 FL=1